MALLLIFATHGVWGVIVLVTMDTADVLFMGIFFAGSFRCHSMYGLQNIYIMMCIHVIKKGQLAALMVT